MSVTAERLMVEVQADVRQALRELGRLEDQTQKNQSRMGKMAKGVAGAFSGAAIAGGIAKTISLAKSFDLTMRQVGVQTGQTGDQLKGLGDLAMKMGADTAFSAQDASDAMLELAKGGLTAADIKAGALKDTLTLAAAGGLDMGSAATYMTQSLNTFGLKAKDGAQIAAALAGGANASTASVESLGMALSQVGPGAANAGMNLQETVAALAAFDNAGIKGSDAGTSLKTMLASLVPATGDAAGAMKKYGLEFVNADGSFKSMTQVAQELKEGLGDLSEKARTVALKKVFGSDATRAATVLMKEGAAGVRDYVKATKDQSTVQKMANTAMGGAEGAWNELTGSLETLGIKIGTALLPAFTAAAKGGSGFLNWLGTLGDELSSGVAWVRNFASGFLTAFKPALAPLGAIIMGVVKALQVFWKVLQPVIRGVGQHAKALGVAAGIITAVFIPAMVRAGVAATVAKVKVVAAFLAKTAAAVKHAAMAGPAMVKMGIFYVQYAAVSTAQAAKVVASWVAQQVAVVKSVAVQAAQMVRLGAAYVAMGLKATVSMAKTVARVVAGWVLMGVQSMLQAARMAAAWVIAMGPIGWAIAAVIAVVIAVVKNWDKVKAATVKVWTAISNAVTKAWDWIKGAVSKAVSFVVGLFMNWTLPGLIIKHWDKIKATFSAGVDRVVTFMKELPGKIMSGLGNLGSLLVNAGKDIIDGLLDGITGAFGAVKDKLGELTSFIPDWKGPEKKDRKLLVKAGRDIISGLIKGFGDSFGDVKDKLRELTEFIRKNMEGGQERRWLARISDTNKKAAKLYARRVQVRKDMEAAMEKLDALRQAKEDFRNSVYDGMAGQANVTNAGSTAATIAQSLTDQVAKVKRFAGMLQTLRQMGFSNAVVMQVASAGVEGGWQAANALVAANSQEVSSINQSMKAITTKAGAASAELAQQMHGAGVSVAEGLVKGLKLKEDDITQAIRRMALNLAGALRKALGIRSPSRVTMGIGDMVGKGLAKGIQGTVNLVKKGALDLADASVPRPPKPPAGGAMLATTPTLAGLQGGHRAGSSVTFVFKTYNPVAEPQSRTTNKALDRAGSLGLV